MHLMSEGSASTARRTKVAAWEAELGRDTGRIVKVVPKRNDLQELTKSLGIFWTFEVLGCLGFFMDVIKLHVATGLANQNPHGSSHETTSHLPKESKENITKY